MLDDTCKEQQHKEKGRKKNTIKRKTTKIISICTADERKHFSHFKSKEMKRERDTKKEKKTKFESALEV